MLLLPDEEVEMEDGRGPELYPRGEAMGASERWFLPAVEKGGGRAGFGTFASPFLRGTYRKV